MKFTGLQILGVSLAAAAFPPKQHNRYLVQKGAFIVRGWGALMGLVRREE